MRPADAWRGVQQKTAEKDSMSAAPSPGLGGDGQRAAAAGAAGGPATQRSSAPAVPGFDPEDMVVVRQAQVLAGVPPPRLHPHLARLLKKHQIDGVRFICSHVFDVRADAGGGVGNPLRLFSLVGVCVCVCRWLTAERGLHPVRLHGTRENVSGYLHVARVHECGPPGRGHGPHIQVREGVGAPRRPSPPKGAPHRPAPRCVPLPYVCACRVARG